MRLLTHNTLRNNCSDAKGQGYPLQLISVKEVRVDDGGNAGGNGGSAADDNNDQDRFRRKQQINFVKGILPILNWDALVQATSQVGIPTCLPATLTEDLAHDPEFLMALYHVLMNVHVVSGVMKCPVTDRKFHIENEIADMIIDEDECERVRY